MRLPSRPTLPLPRLGALASSLLASGLIASIVVLAPDALAQSQGQVAEEFEGLHFRSIGPATMSGRIADVAVYEANPAVYYVGTAHGGVWKTTSNGATFEPLFQDQGLIAIGDVAVSQINPDLVWVGAGESNNRQSTSWGGGVWKSTDGGKTFTRMGLAQSKHINRIVIHPANNDVVLVAATGPLFGPGGERGIYKTTDGGKTWKQVLVLDDDTGANDLAISLSEPNVLYASSYQRRRTACCMNGGGPGSAIWRSTDGGDTWTAVPQDAFAAGPGSRDGDQGWRIFISGLVADPTTPGLLYASCTEHGYVQSSGRGVFRSTDHGATWRPLTLAGLANPAVGTLTIDPVNPARLYVGTGGNGLFRLGPEAEE